MAVGMFSPGQVRLGSNEGGSLPQRTASPYIPLQPFKPAAPTQAPAAPAQPTAGGQNAGVAAPQAVRATEGGPFDQAYRQNLATFAGGGMARPGGNLTFNPTATVGASDSLFGDLGGPGPTDLLSQALGGGGLMFQNPQPPTPQTALTKKPVKNPLQWWGDQFSQNGRMMT